jgi:uncharacterized protein YjbI with pentapeptide repeats
MYLMKGIKRLSVRAWEKIKRALPKITWLWFLLGLILFLLFWFFPEWQGHRLVGVLEANEIPKQVDEYRRTWAQIIGGLAILIGVYFTWRRIDVAEEGQITERFTRAIEQLGDERMAVRLGGLYALERIAKDSKKDHWTVMEVLTAYIRDNRNVDMGANEAKEPEKEHIPTDIQAILTVIGRRKWFKNEEEPIDLSRTCLKGVKLERSQFEGSCFIGSHLEGADLKGVHLEDADLGGVHFEGALLRGAHLEKATLWGAYLERADLRGAHLEGGILWGAHLERANLGGTCLDGAYIGGAHLEGANLRGAHMIGANLLAAHFEGADLGGVYLSAANIGVAHFEGANLWCAHLEGADLGGVHLEGANLGGAHLEGANLWGAHLEGANLDRTHLEGADMYEAVGLTQEQIDSAFTDGTTILPGYLKEGTRADRPKEASPQDDTEHSL